MLCVQTHSESADKHEFCIQVQKRGFFNHYGGLTHLSAGSAFEAVRVEPVDVKNMNSALDAEVMELARHFEEQQVILG